MTLSIALLDDYQNQALAAADWHTLDDAKVDPSALDDVILVGGMTRMPLIQSRVAEFFGMEPCKGVHPDEVVALGAAIQAAALVDDEEDAD